MPVNAVLISTPFPGRASVVRLSRRLAILSLVPLCCVLLAVSSAVIAVIPLRRLAAVLGQPLGPVTCTPVASATQARRARVVRGAIGIAARFVPFRSDCYPQALTVLAMCRLLQVPTALHFGVRAEPVHDAAALRLAGHVWVVAGTVAICGGQPRSTEFASVACFLRGPVAFAPSRSRAAGATAL